MAPTVPIVHDQSLGSKVYNIDLALNDSHTLNNQGTMLLGLLVAGTGLLLLLRRR